MSAACRQVKCDGDPESGEQAAPLELGPCDAAEMVSWRHPEPDLVLEMEHLGRGTEFYDPEVGTRGAGAATRRHCGPAVPPETRLPPQNWRSTLAELNRSSTWLSRKQQKYVTVAQCFSLP